MIFRFFKNTPLLMFMAIVMAGCVQEYGGGEIPTPPNDNEVTITVTVPGQQIPTTRSIAGANGEATVAFIDLLVFGTDGKFSRHVPGTNLAPVADDPNYKVTFKAALSVEENDEMVVILANVPASTIAKLEEGDTKLEALSKLTDTWESAWKTNPDDYKPIPMYGEVSIGSISTTVTLTRMLARVDLVNSATTDFTLTDVYVVNRNTKGYIAQAWNKSTGDRLNPQYVGDPMVPEDANPLGAGVVSTIDNALRYEYGSGLSGEIYLYEAKVNPNEVMEENIDHTKAICLIVKGKWLEDGKDYYYRIDFTAAKGAAQNPEDVEYMPVYRNHLYTFDIEAVNGPGYVDFTDALKSFGVLNNLKTRLHTVDMSGIKYMVFNGQHYLGVNSVEFCVGDLTRTNELTIMTNAKDLKAMVAEGDDWIDNLKIQNVSDDKYILYFNTNDKDGYEIRTGNIALVAGRLQFEVEVIQSVTFRFARSNIVMYVDGKGNKILTFAETPNDNIGSKSVRFKGRTVEVPAMPANVQGLHFRFGGLVGLSSSCTATQATSMEQEDIVFWPEEYTKPDNWIFNFSESAAEGQVPYGDGTIFPFPAELDLKQDIYAQYNGGIGYDSEAGYGDICRYISDQGWVDGEWRMPTEDDYARLYYDETSKTKPNGEMFGVLSSGYAAMTNEAPMYGYTQVPNGRVLGYDVRTSDIEPNKLANPDRFRVVLPATGYRAYNSGAIFYPGMYGFYWSATSCTFAGASYHMYLFGVGTFPERMGSRDFGYGVRCIRPD